ncbi:MAG: hemagglutinin repeat-containing protein [Moraxellaceae bacterium]|nr:hemagglutinin repeat-containing protein [Moraxellaceae bacterium]
MMNMVLDSQPHALPEKGRYRQALLRKGHKGLVQALIVLQVWQPAFAGIAITTAGTSKDVAANGVPIVNIAAPGASGISRNTYTQFDVGSAGLIFNNSAQATNTQLGGFIPGNAGLGQSSARLILNEVSGSLPSQLNGYMEIAGQKAEMVIANPAGITCDGCGFINTNRATLTTGLPKFDSDGSLIGFTVENGFLRIEGDGLNATNIERLNLYSRALILNAELHAKSLEVVTGANQIDVRTGETSLIGTASPAPAYSIDSSMLGGMYANTIRLVGTEAGVGMRLAGPVAALTGNLEILGNGDVQLARVSAKGEMSLGSSDQLRLGAQVTAGGKATLQADGIVLEGTALLAAATTRLIAENISTDIGAQVAARGDLQLVAGTLDNAGVMTTANGLRMDISSQLTNSGSIEAQTAFNLNADTLTNSGNLLLLEGEMNINVSQFVDNRAGSILNGGTRLTVKAAELDNRGGEISSNGISTITVSGDNSLLNNEGILQGNAGLVVNSSGLDNSNGQVLSDALIALQMNNDVLLNKSGVIETIDAISVESAASLDNSDGKILANGDITLALMDGLLTNARGLIESGSDLDISGVSEIHNEDGVLRASKNLTLYLPFFDRAASGGQYSAAEQLAIHATNGMLFSGEEFTTPGGLLLDAGAGDIQLDSRVLGGAATILNGRTITIGDDGFLATQGALTVSSDSLTNLGVMYGREALTLHIEEELNNGSADTPRAASIISEGDISITRADGSRLAILNNYAAQIESLQGNITIKADVVNNINVGWAVASDVWIEKEPVVYHDDYSPTGNMSDIVSSNWSAYSDGDYYFELTWDDSIAGYPRDSAANSCTNGACYYFYRDKEVITHSDVLSQGSRAWIIASTAAGTGNGNIWIDANTLNNNRSSISAAGTLDIKVDDTGSINNIATTLFDVSDIKRETRWKACGSSGACSRGQLFLNLDSEALESRTDQIITATLEGGVDANLHGTVVNGEKENVGHTVTSGTGAFSSVPTSAPSDQAASEVTTLGELGMLDPTSRPGFQLPGNGIFNLNNNPAHPYLIETDPAINTYTGFLGSAYLIDYLDWAPDITLRRLGDSYYELMLIREALLASTGSRFVDASVTDERMQYEYLMQNAIAASESLQLSPGIALSRDQIDSLQQDIVWMEERLIAGQKVLVPVVYLAQGSSRLLSDGAVISGGSIDIDGDTFANAGIVQAHDSINISMTHDISNLGGTIESLGDIELYSGADILNESGTISGHDVFLQAEGDIISRTLAQRDEAGSGSNSSWSTIVGDTATVTATGNLTQNAGGDIRLEAATLTGATVELVAGKNIILDTLKVNEGYRLSSGNWQQAEAYVRHLQTQVLAAQDLSISAGTDIIAIAANLEAGSEATLEAGHNITLLAVEETNHYEEHNRSDGSLGRSKSHDLVHDESGMLGTTIEVGNSESDQSTDLADSGKLVMSAGGDITLYASQVVATGQADITAGNNINVIAGINTISHSEKSSKEGVGTFSNNQNGYITQQAIASGISAGGDLNLNAAKDIRLTASVLHSDQTLRIGDEAIDQYSLMSGSAQRPMNVIVDTLALTNESWNETQKGFSGPMEELVKGLSVVFTPMLSIASAGQFDMPEIKIGSHDYTSTQDILQAGSAVYARDLSINVEDKAAFIGSVLNVQETAIIQAENIIIDAAAERHDYIHELSSDTVKGLGMKLSDSELRLAGIQETKISNQNMMSIMDWRGSVISAGELVLQADNDVVIMGSEINVLGNAEISAGGSIAIGGRESEVKTESRETIETITMGVSIRNAYVDAVNAIKSVDYAEDAVKEAKRALEQAEIKAAQGELEASDVEFFRINLVAATANLAQATIVAVSSLDSAADTAKGSAGTGFYLSGTVSRDTTVTSSSTYQSSWEGSAINIGGNAVMQSADSLTINGSSLSVTGGLNLDASSINIIAGSESQVEKSSKSESHEGIGISMTAGNISASMDTSQRDTDADSYALHYVSSQIKAGSLTSTSDIMNIKGAQIIAGDIDIETDKLTVASLQDERSSQSKTFGISASIGIGSKIGADPISVGLSSLGGGIEQSESSSSSAWVAEQTMILGTNSIKIRAKDSVLVGALIANATYSEQGVLVDKGLLDFETETLLISDLLDFNNSKTTGFNVGTSFGFGDDEEKVGKPGKPPTGQTTVGGQYLGHEAEQITRTTLGQGTIVIGGEVLDMTSADELGLAGLNRDINLAQEVILDNDIGGLNTSVTVDHRIFTDEGQKSLGNDFSDIGDNTVKALKGAGRDTQFVGDVTGDGIHEVVKIGVSAFADAENVNKYTAAIEDNLGWGFVIPTSLNNGGLLLGQVPVYLQTDDINQRRIIAASPDSEYIAKNPDLGWISITETEGFYLLPEEKRIAIEHLMVTTVDIDISKSTATYQNTTNGMLNSEALALYNGLMQTHDMINGSPDQEILFTLNYNPTRDVISDGLESTIDKLSIYFKAPEFATSVAKETGIYINDVMLARGDERANFANHSQGNLLNYSGMLAIGFNPDIEFMNGKENNFTINMFGSPVNAVDFNGFLEKKGILLYSSSVNSGDFVGQTLGGNYGLYVYQGEGTVFNNITNIDENGTSFIKRITATSMDVTQDAVVGRQGQTSVIEDLMRLFRVDSTHSNYNCVGIVCGVNPSRVTSSSAGAAK